MNGVTILFVYAVIMILATVILTKKEKNVEQTTRAYQIHAVQYLRVIFML